MSKNGKEKAKPRRKSLQTLSPLAFFQNNQKMKSVWNDCVHVMNKTLELLEDIYGLPSSLSKGVTKDEA